MTPWWVTLLGVVVTALGGWVLYLRLRADRPKLRADALKSFNELVAELREEADGLRDSQREMEESIEREIEAREAAEDQHRQCQESIAELSERLASVERAFPVLLVAAGLHERSKELLQVFDESPLPCVLSAQDEAQHGRLVFASKAFCAALGRSQEEILDLGWRMLCHPEDLARTDVVEGHAAFGPVRIRNRFLHSHGHYVGLRWMSTRYIQPKEAIGEGVAFAWVAVLDDEPVLEAAA